MVGASGAISGVMGAYVMLYPRVRVHMLVVLVVFITRIAVPAYLMLGYWFLLQLLGGSTARARAAWRSGPTSADSWPGPFSSRSSRTPELVAQHRAMSRTTERLGYRERF